MQHHTRTHRVEILICLGLMFCISGVQNVTAADVGVQIEDLKLNMPVAAAPYYSFTARLKLPASSIVDIQDLKINGQDVLNYILLDESDSFEPETPNNRRQMVIARVAKSPRPDREYKNPLLVGRLDWEASQQYKLGISVRLPSVSADVIHAEASVTAPSEGGYWNSAWKKYQSVLVQENDGLDRKMEPVRATLLFYPEDIAGPNRELRVVHYDPKKNAHTNIPFQIIDDSFVHAAEPPAFNEKGHRKAATMVPTRSVTLLFLADVKANENGIFLVFYGNDTASLPQSGNDIEVSGDVPGVVVDTGRYLAKLHDATGMLDELTIKAKPQYTFVHKKETNGAIQWNPGCYAPPRPWVHVSDWEPGKYDYEYEESRGPLVFRTRRWGEMPLLPELACSMVYEFYADVPYFVMRSTIHVRNDISVLAIRNAEVVFAREAFAEAAWWNLARDKVETCKITSFPDLTEWTMPEDTPWLAFFDRDKGCGYAGIQMRHANGALMGLERTVNPYMYITTGPWIYWTRALAYPYGSRNPQQLVEIPAGSVFLEEWAYLPFELGKKQSRMFAEVEYWQERLAHPLHIHVDEPIDAKMEVPEEIYLEPEKTGWE